MNCLAICNDLKDVYRHKSIKELQEKMLEYFATGATRDANGVDAKAWTLATDEVMELVKEIAKYKGVAYNVAELGLKAQAILDKLKEV